MASFSLAGGSELNTEIKEQESTLQVEGIWELELIEMGKGGEIEVSQSEGSWKKEGKKQQQSSQIKRSERHHPTVDLSWVLTPSHFGNFPGIL